MLKAFKLGVSYLSGTVLSPASAEYVRVFADVPAECFKFSKGESARDFAPPSPFFPDDVSGMFQLTSLAKSVS